MAELLPQLGFTLFPFIGAAINRASLGTTKKSQDWFDVSKANKV